MPIILIRMILEGSKLLQSRYTYHPFSGLLTNRLHSSKSWSRSYFHSKEMKCLKEMKRRKLRASALEIEALALCCKSMHFSKRNWTSFSLRMLLAKIQVLLFMKNKHNSKLELVFHLWPKIPQMPFRRLPRIAMGKKTS